MKILSRVGGAFLLLVLAIAAILGFQTPTGRQMWDSLWSAASTVLRWVRDHVPNLTSSTTGDAWKAIAIGGVFVILMLSLAKKPVSVRAFTALVIVAGLGAFVLWNPSVVQNL